MELTELIEKLNEGKLALLTDGEIESVSFNADSNSKNENFKKFLETHPMNSELLKDVKKLCDLVNRDFIKTCRDIAKKNTTK